MYITVATLYIRDHFCGLCVSVFHPMLAILLPTFLILDPFSYLHSYIHIQLLIFYQTMFIHSFQEIITLAETIFM